VKRIFLCCASALSCFTLTAQSPANGVDSTKKPVLLDDVVVTGSKVAVAKNYIPFGITVINRKQIDNSGESALLPVLSDNVPGLFVTEKGITGFGVSTGAAGAISMRGLSGSPNTRVLVLINGVPQFMGIFGHPLPDAYVASDVEKVEVLHGAGSVLYGSNAMGGVVNIITRAQQADGYSVNGRVMYGSFNTQKYMLNAGWRKGKWNIMASLNHDQTDGHRPSSDFNISNGYFKAGYSISRHFTITAETNIAKYIATDPGMEGGAAGNNIDILRGASYITVTNTCSKSSGSLQLFYNYGKHAISDGFRSTDGNYGFSLFQSIRYLKNNIITAGFDYKKYGGRAQNIFAVNGQGIVFGDHTLSSYAPYLLTQQKIFGKLMISAGIRLEHNSASGEVWIPSGGVCYTATNNTTLKASVSKGFRSPTILDLYLFPPANPLLKPETMMNYECTVNRNWLDGKLKTGVTLFHVQGSNMIQTIFQSSGPKNVNTGIFNNNGIELSVQYTMSSNWSMLLAYGYTDMRYAVVAAPKHLLNTGINYSSSRLLVNVKLQAVNGLFTQTGSVFTQSNYVLFNAAASYRLHPWVSVFVKTDNLTNQRYQINDGYPMPGITAMGGLHFHFSDK